MNHAIAIMRGILPRTIRGRSRNEATRPRRRRPPSLNRLLSSHAAPECPIRAFAVVHRGAAAEVLTVPPPSHTSRPLPASADHSLEGYLAWRGWDVDGVLC